MVALLVGREQDGWMVALLIGRGRAGRRYWLGESGTAGWWRCWLGESWMVAPIVWERAERLDGGLTGWGSAGRLVEIRPAT